MLKSGLLTILALAIPFTCASYIESIAANVDSRSEKKHEKFVPLVAFECGFRNKFMGEDGEWVTDVERYATCLTGKLDILKYCRKAYPNLDVTNIVEYSHEVKVSGWCKEEGSPCKWTHTVRPYRCIIGEFHSDALQVPHGCKFGHVSDPQSCDSYLKWQNKANQQCETKSSSDGVQMTVRSFAILEPCGLDLFTGVEYVCCPVDKQETPKVVDLDERKVIEDDDDEDDDDDDEDEDDDEDDVDYSDGEDNEDEKDNSQDPYFKTSDSDPATEHDRYKAAERRLDLKHRKKIDKVMQEWSELEERYKNMKGKDEKGAENYKNEMTSRFQKTVASLEEENKEQKKQIEDVHEERVQANLNERKRQATHDFRAALAIQVEKPNKHNVLKSLKQYIRAEEKDRTHMLGRYRHLIRSDQIEAETFRPVLLHRLHYIDLRINGTLAMLHDFPDLERQVRPIALEFWHEYRGDNTPAVSDEQYTGIGTVEYYAKLLDFYKDSYNRDHHPELVEKKTTVMTTTTALPKEIDAKDSSEDSEEGDDDLGKDEHSIHGDEVVVEKILKKVPEKTPVKVKDEQTQTDDDSEEDDDEDEDDISDDDKSVERELHVEIEPIVSEPVRVHDLPPRPAYSKHDALEHDKEHPRSWNTSQFLSSTQLMVLCVVCVAVICFTIALTSRRRRRHAGFIEVDVCTPEERHVNGMQVNGYENPTYTFFDGKP